MARAATLVTIFMALSRRPDAGEGIICLLEFRVPREMSQARRALSSSPESREGSRARPETRPEARSRGSEMQRARVLRGVFQAAIPLALALAGAGCKSPPTGPSPGAGAADAEPTTGVEPSTGIGD